MASIERAEFERFARALATVRPPAKAYDVDKNPDAFIEEYWKFATMVAKEMMAEIRARTAPKPRFKEIISGVIDDARVNAGAFWHDGAYVIGLTWGIPYQLLEVYLRLASHSEFLPA